MTADSGARGRGRRRREGDSAAPASRAEEGSRERSEEPGRGPGKPRRRRGERRRGANGGRPSGRRKRRAPDPLTRAVNGVFAVAIEALKVLREMAAIPWQLWLFVAELAGAAVLAVWLRVVWPLLVAAFRAGRWLVRLGQRHVTPARAVAAVAVAALACLAASQWLDYRSVAVGTDAYSGGVEAIAPPPAVETERAGDAHAWAMVPLAAVGLAILALAYRGRPRLARLLVAVGLAAIAIAVGIDAPRGLDEGDAAIAYEGAEASLVEGFWAQIASGAVVIFCGLALPLYLRPAWEAARPGTVRAERGRARRRWPARRPGSASA